MGEDALVPCLKNLTPVVSLSSLNNYSLFYVLSHWRPALYSVRRPGCREPKL